MKSRTMVSDSGAGGAVKAARARRSVHAVAGEPKALMAFRRCA